MNIAIIRRWDVSIVDGVNRFIFTLANGFRRLGHRVAVFCHLENPSNLSEVFDADVEVHAIGNTCGRFVKCMWDYLTRGSKILGKFEPDMVIVNGVVPLRLRAFKIAVNHGNAVFELRRNSLKRYITKRLYNAYDYVVCVSSKVASEMRELGLSCDEVIPIPLILENYTPKPRSERKPIVLHVGTRPSKRPDVSVEAVKLLREWGYDVKLVIVGYYERRYDWIVVREKVPDRELRDLYSKALALIHPSTWEGFSYVVLEAQASGTPVIVRPGVPDEALISGRTGFKVASFDPRDYAEKLRILLERMNHCGRA